MYGMTESISDIIYIYKLIIRNISGQVKWKIPYEDKLTFIFTCPL